MYGELTSMYLVAVMDWYSRYALAWELSDRMTVKFCIACLDRALKIGIPKIHNSDQKSQFTSDHYLDVLKRYSEIAISMDGKGRAFDNIFVEHL